MSLISLIKQNQVSARKTKDVVAAQLLTTLIGEAEMIGKNAGNREVTDSEVVALTKKFISNLNETLKVLAPNDVRVPDLMCELEILEQYLPQQMTDLEIKEAVGNIKNEIGAGPKDMGKVMGLLKARYDGKYDGKAASAIVKTVLAG